MGLGDWIMATADAREAHARTGKKVLFGDGQKYFYEQSVFKNNPKIADVDGDVVWVANFPGSRPYIAGNNGQRIIFNDGFRASAGELYLGGNPPVLNDPFILVEPNVNPRFAHAINKSWGGWKALFKAELPWVQVGADGSRAYTQFIHTPDFRSALHILSQATLFVGTDGALHHAAAALGIPAVVIWSGFTSPQHLGYDSHINVHDGSRPCGFYGGECDHCRKKREAIPADYILSLVEAEFEKRTRRLVA